MEKVLDLIKNSKNIAILTHISEDADAVGSALALKEALLSMGKDAKIFVSGKIEKRLGFLPSDYTIYQGENEVFDLCIALDSADIGRLGERKSIFSSALHTVNIDHHITNPSYAEANYVVGGCSSTGEVLYDVLCALGVEITKQIATYLYVAIVSDSGAFKYSSVTPKTMRVASELMEKGIDHTKICQYLFESEAEDALKLKAHITRNLKSFYNGQVVVALVPKCLFKRFKTEEKDVGDIVNIPRSVRGCEIAVSIRDVGDKIKVSLRSNGKYDVSEIAGIFGGGGHKMASGITFNDMSMGKVKKLILKTIGEVIK